MTLNKLSMCYSPPGGAAVLAEAAAIIIGVAAGVVAVVKVVPFNTPGAAVALAATVPTSMEHWFACSCPELLLL